jgi:hypothetical protein
MSYSSLSIGGEEMSIKAMAYACIKYIEKTLPYF